MNKDDKEYQERLLSGQPREGSYCEECKAYNGSEDCAPFGNTRRDAMKLTDEYREKYFKLKKCSYFESMFPSFIEFLNKYNYNEQGGISLEIKEPLGILSTSSKYDEGYSWDNKGTIFYFRIDDFKKILSDLKFTRKANLDYIAGENNWKSYKDNSGDSSSQDSFLVGKIKGEITMNFSESKLEIFSGFIPKEYECKEKGIDMIKRYLVKNK